MRECRSCGKPVAFNSWSCPWCGQDKPGLPKELLWICWGILGFLALIILIASIVSP